MTAQHHTHGSPDGPPAWLVGAQWAEVGVRQPGWLILPLRGFLAVTFVYAGLQKLANPAYLDPHNPASVVGQMHALQSTSPIGPLLQLSAHAPTAVGLLIAFGELAVGVGTLLGLFTRLSAAGGMLLSLTFLLTVSWNTTPYYYGSDVVFLFAWTVLLGFGSAGVLSIDGWLVARARHAAASGAADVDELDRRSLLAKARAAALVAVVAGAGGGIAAAGGRIAGDSSGAASRTLPPRSRIAPPERPTASAAPSPTTTATPARSAAPAPGTAIGPSSAVPVGRARSFTDPASGEPAWVVHVRSDRFVAFSAVCTHAGCTVGFDPSGEQFVCPCHGGTFDARTGQVLGGPPPAPLRSIPVHLVSGQLRVD